MEFLGGLAVKVGVSGVRFCQVVATHNEAGCGPVLSAGSAFEEFEEGRFVEDGDVELAGFVELGAGFLAGDDVVGFL